VTVTLNFLRQIRLIWRLYFSFRIKFAESRKVTGTIPDDVIEYFFFSLPIHSSRNMALGLNQPPTQMSIRNIPGG
jgi:hypothetical protein